MDQYASGRNSRQQRRRLEERKGLRVPVGVHAPHASGSRRLARAKAVWRGKQARQLRAGRIRTPTSGRRQPDSQCHPTRCCGLLLLAAAATAACRCGRARIPYSTSFGAAASMESLHESHSRFGKPADWASLHSFAVCVTFVAENKRTQNYKEKK